MFIINIRWNGNVMTIESCDGTWSKEFSLSEGSSSYIKACLESLNFTIKVTGGTDQVCVFFSLFILRYIFLRDFI